MIKLLISKEYKGKTLEQIEEDINRIKREVEVLTVDEVEVVNSLYDYCLNNDYKPLEYLRYSVDKLIESNVLYLGSNWRTIRSSSILHAIALSYNIDMIKGE